MAYKSSARGSAPVRLVAIHTTEGAMTAASLGSYFYQPATEASSHVGIDDSNTLQYVGYDRSAWTIRSANPISDNAEICGFASWSREDWLGKYRPRLERAAAWARARCLARGIPRRWLTPAQVAQGMSGIIGHVDWTNGMHDGTHTDPGAGFPKDVFMQLVAADEEMVMDSEVRAAFVNTQERINLGNSKLDQALDLLNDIHVKVMAYLNSQTAEDLNEDRKTNQALVEINATLQAVKTKLGA